jgi:Uma2 family endonuclease
MTPGAARCKGEEERCLLRARRTPRSKPANFRAIVLGMTAVPKSRMTLADFLDWSDRQEGKYELVHGQIVDMAPGVIEHARAKLAAVNALAGAIKRAGLPREALIDGPGVAIDEQSCYIPDVSVHCGERAPGDVRLVPNPAIIVEVLSPSTQNLDKTGKLIDYFSLASVYHYLIIDLRRRVVLHHRRGDNGLIATAILRQGDLRLNPPGLSFPVEEILGAV